MLGASTSEALLCPPGQLLGIWMSRIFETAKLRQPTGYILGGADQQRDAGVELGGALLQFRRIFFERGFLRLLGQLGRDAAAGSGADEFFARQSFAFNA
jgi:hypothetical protein